jgi:hypothetical protein
MADTSYPIYPGELLDSSSCERVLRVFLFKFFRKEHVTWQPQFDRAARSMSKKKYRRFIFKGPYWGESLLNATSVDRSWMKGDFFLSRQKVFFMPHFVKKGEFKRIYRVDPQSLSRYFNEEQPLGTDVEFSYVFDSSFTWFLYIQDSIRPGGVDDADFSMRLYVRPQQLGGG